jgi:hypothetical protein
VYGRPVAFAFGGTRPGGDGSRLFLKAPLLRQSLNYKLLASGNSYPLFYDTLFADLRATLTSAAQQARRSRRGLWRQDRSSRGISAADQTDLEQHAVVFPKLFRRLTSYLAGGGTSLEGFLTWLAADNEQVLDLTTGNFTHFDNVLALTRNKVRLIRLPEALVFVSAKTASTKVSPWLRH